MKIEQTNNNQGDVNNNQIPPPGAAVQKEMLALIHLREFCGGRYRRGWEILYRPDRNDYHVTIQVWAEAAVRVSAATIHDAVCAAVAAARVEYDKGPPAKEGRLS